MASPPVAPAVFGDVFLLLVRQQRRDEFQKLLIENDYDWRPYYSGFTPEEARWVFVNRPDPIRRLRHVS